MLLKKKKNLSNFLKKKNEIFLNGKILINFEILLTKLSRNYQKGIFSILKNLKIKNSEKKKIWFIEIDKIFKEKNLKIFYLPFENLEKLIYNKDFLKMPDPKKYIIGLTHFYEKKENLKKKIFEKFKIKKYYINKNKNYGNIFSEKKNFSLKKKKNKKFFFFKKFKKN